METEQYVRRGGQRSGNDGGKWKKQKITASSRVLNAAEKECFVQREALMQDECQAFWAGSVINTCKVPNDDKICLWWEIWRKHCGLYIFGTMMFQYQGLINVSLSI